MADDDKTICDDHGPQQTTFVCTHILDGVRAGKRVGFHTAIEPDNPRPDAWCDECAQRFQEAGGEWEGEPEAKAQIKILCGLCYDRAKTFHLAGVS
jgi:hypothetical protein